MKINTKQYARALYESVKGKNKKDLPQILKNFVKILINKNDVAKFDSIINDFNTIWNKEEGVVNAEVLSSQKLNRKTLNSISSYLITRLSVNNINIETREDSTILGGIVLKYGDKILDGSLKTKLCTLGKKLKN